MQQYK